MASRLNGKITPALDRVNAFGKGRDTAPVRRYTSRAELDYARSHDGELPPTATYERPRSQFLGGRFGVGPTPHEAAEAMERGLAEEGERNNPPPPSRFGAPVTDRYVPRSSGRRKRG